MAGGRPKRGELYYYTETFLPMAYIMLMARAFENTSQTFGQVDVTIPQAGLISSSSEL
jgi:hypothetical protein